MTRRPSLVHCSSCGREVSARNAYEKVTCLALTNSGKGTLTNPRNVERHGEYVCRKCVMEDDPNQGRLV